MGENDGCKGMFEATTLYNICHFTFSLSGKLSSLAREIQTQGILRTDLEQKLMSIESVSEKDFCR